MTQPVVASLVLQRSQDVEARRSPRRADRREQIDDDGREEEPDERAVGIANAAPSSASASVMSAARSIPATTPSVAPSSAVMMLSWRSCAAPGGAPCRRRAASRARASAWKTVSTSVLTIPDKPTMTDSASSTYRTFEHPGELRHLRVLELLPGLHLRMGKRGERALERGAAGGARAAGQLRAAAADGGDELHAGCPRGRLLDVGRERRKAALGRQRAVGDEQLIDGVDKRAAQALSEARDEGHERQPDHESGGRGRGPARIAHGVGARAGRRGRRFASPAPSSTSDLPRHSLRLRRPPPAARTSHARPRAGHRQRTAAGLHPAARCPAGATQSR